MNRKITPYQAAQIRHLVNVEHKKLREVVIFYPLSISQIHRIATGENWQSVTGAATPLGKESLRNTDSKR